MLYVFQNAMEQSCWAVNKLQVYSLIVSHHLVSTYFLIQNVTLFRMGWATWAIWEAIRNTSSLSPWAILILSMLDSTTSATC